MRVSAEQPSGLWGGTGWESNNEKFMIEGEGWSHALIWDSIWSQNIPCREQGRKQISSSFLSMFQNHRLEDRLPLPCHPLVSF